MEIVKIGNEDFLLRRFPIGDPNYVRPDGSVTSFAFTPRKSDLDGLSVDLERLTTLNAAVIDPGKYGITRISVERVRSIAGIDCIHAPIPENYAHSLITGKITKSVRSNLADFAKPIR